MARHEVSEGKVTWIHISEPTEEDFAYVRELHTFDEIVMDYVSTATLHPTLEEFGDNIYFILHFPVIHETDEHNSAAEVDFLVTKKMLVTITYEKYDRLDELFEKCEKDLSTRAKYLRSHSGYILYFILEYLYQRMIRDRDFIERVVDDVEQEIFANSHDDLVERISNISRDILDFRRVFKTQGSVLTFLPKALERMLGKDSIPKFTNILVTQQRIQELLDSHKDTIDSLQTSYRALIDSRTSRVIKVLTIFSTIVLPLSLVAGIWGMNHKGVPLTEGPHDFWIVIGAMGVIAAALVAGFKWARWI